MGATGTKPTKKFNVAVLGAAGGIGQPLSLLLATSEHVKVLHTYDVMPVVNGVGVDLSHIETECQVKGFAGDMKDKEVSKAKLAEALKGIDIVVIPAGVPRKPGMTRDDLFNVNAGIVANLVEGVADNCPNAMICIISNPVNSTVPIAAEVLKKKGCYNRKHLFGVSTLDVVRANKFVSEKCGIPPSEVNAFVIAGHSGSTIIPLLSQLPEAAKAKLSEDDIKALTERIQNAGTEVVDAKAGGGSATLSMAYAGARFVKSLMRGMSGEQDVVECSYVPSTITPLAFFASRVRLGPSGAEEVLPLPADMSDFEKSKLENEAKPDLQKSIDAGVAFVASAMASL